MKINVDQKMMNFIDNKEIMRQLPLPPEGEKPKKLKSLTLKLVCLDALFANYPNEPMDGEEKVERYKLGQLINKGGKVRLNSERITLLKKVIGKYWGTMVSGQSWLMLEQKLNKTKKS